MNAWYFFALAKVTFVYFSHLLIFYNGGAKANGREPKTGLGWVFNFQLGCFDDVHVLIYVETCPHL